MNRKVQVGLALLVVAVLGVGGYILGTSGDSEDDVDVVVSTSEGSEAAQQDQSSEGSASADVLLTSEYFGAYTIEDEQYGTSVTVTIDEAAGTRTIVSNALPNHSTGEFPNDDNPNTISEQSASYEYPLNPVFTGTPVDAQVPGVALNGVKFEPGTAETFTCTSGETYRVEAIQDLTSLGLDVNNAHVQPTGEYHYHGISAMMTDAFDNGTDLVHVGFMADGHMVYYSKTGAYASSYQLGSGERSGSGCSFSIPNRSVDFSTTKDGSVTSDWDFVEGLGDLDECNGITINGEYIYLMTDEFPYISRCLMGEASATGPGGGGGAPSGPPPGQGPR